MIGVLAYQDESYGICTSVVLFGFQTVRSAMALQTDKSWPIYGVGHKSSLLLKLLMFMLKPQVDGTEKSRAYSCLNKLQ